MITIEGLYFPRPEIKRKGELPKEQVAKLLLKTYQLKGIPEEYFDLYAEALRLTLLDGNPAGNWLSDERVRFYLEVWPISALRMTRMKPPEQDMLGIGKLVVAANWDFRAFAEILKSHPEIISSDKGFDAQPERDRIPPFGVRGKLDNHIYDGHHRTTLRVWGNEKNIPVITAYRNFRVSFAS